MLYHAWELISINFNMRSSRGFDLIYLKFNSLVVRLIAVKDWAKTPLNHVDLYHLGMRFIGFLTVNVLLRFIC
jgi:hypothetical protein